MGIVDLLMITGTHAAGVPSENTSHTDISDWMSSRLYECYIIAIWFYPQPIVGGKPRGYASQFEFLVKCDQAVMKIGPFRARGWSQQNMDDQSKRIFNGQC